MTNTERYQAAFRLILKHEVGPHPDGGFVNHPNDPGGATKYGVSLRWLRSIGHDIDGDDDVDVDDVKALERADAYDLYHDRFWEPLACTDFRVPVGEKLVDMAVNMGKGQAVTLLQRACNALRAIATFKHKRIAEDGVVGPQTKQAALAHDPRALACRMGKEQGDFYQTLIAQNSKFKAFERGWMKRANSLCGTVPAYISLDT